MRTRLVTRESGFTLIETLVTVALFATLAGVGVALLVDVADSYRLGTSARSVERELQAARLKAVQANNPIRVRFNCPGAGQYRRVELIGTTTVPAAADGASTRCDSTNLPGDADNNILTRPNHDGLLQTLDPKVTFTATTDLEFWPDGTVHQDTGTNPWGLVPGTGATITMAKGTRTRSVTVNAFGRIRLQ